MATQQQQPIQQEQRVYPGSLQRYRDLRFAREAFIAQNTHEELGMSPDALSTLVGLSVVEELAGLAYLLDSIRYSARQAQGGGQQQQQH